MQLFRGPHRRSQSQECVLICFSRLTESSIVPISESITDKRVTNAPHVIQDQFSAEPHQRQRTMPPMRPWRQPPRPVMGRQRQSCKWTQMPRCCGSRDGMQRNHQEHSLRNRSARETRKDCDHEGGYLGDYGGRLLKNTP